MQPPCIPLVSATSKAPHAAIIDDIFFAQS